MRYIQGIYEREFNKEWFDKNPDNYITKSIDYTKSDEYINDYTNIKIKRRRDNLDLEIKNIIDNTSIDDITLLKKVMGSTTVCILNHNKLGDLGRVFVDNNQNIKKDDSLNRTHISSKWDYIGLGLYKICYKKVAKEFGYIRTSEYLSSMSARKLWSSLITDSDLYALKYTKLESKSIKSNGFVVIWKNQPLEHIKDIVYNFTKNDNIIFNIEYCDSLKELLSN